MGTEGTGRASLPVLEQGGSGVLLCPALWKGEAERGQTDWIE